MFGKSYYSWNKTKNKRRHDFIKKNNFFRYFYFGNYKKKFYTTVSQ